MRPQAAARVLALLSKNGELFTSNRITLVQFHRRQERVWRFVEARPPQLKAEVLRLWRVANPIA